MPIYAYKCASCGHAKDVLRKMSDAPLTDCPACGQSTFQKQVTAAGFQLKGSGWYVTDFRNGNAAAAPAASGGEAPAPSAGGADKSTPAVTPPAAPAGSSAAAATSAVAPAATAKSSSSAT